MSTYATPALSIPGWWPKKDWCEVFGVSPKQCERYCQDGTIQFRRKGAAIEIKMPDARTALRKHDVEKGKEHAKPKTEGEARARREAAQADLEELRLARELRQTILVDDALQLKAEDYGRVRAKLLTLAPRAAGAAFGAATIQECQAKIQPLVLELMEELAEGEDLPDEDDDDDARPGRRQRAS